MADETVKPQYTRDQLRAQFAIGFVEKDLNGVGPKDFATACKKACTRIMNAGLGGALAFMLSKADQKKDEGLKYDRVVNALAKHLANKNPDAYLKDLVMFEANALRKDTEEAMAVLQWLARVADGKAIQINDLGSDQHV